MTLRPARVENHPSDKGCRLSPSCLECSELVCKDERPGYYERERQRLTPQVLSLHQQGLTWVDIAKLVGIHRMTAMNWYKRAKDG